MALLHLQSAPAISRIEFRIWYLNLPRQEIRHIGPQRLHGGIGLGHPGGGHDALDEGVVAALELRAHDGQPLRSQVHAVQRARHHAQQPVVSDELLWKKFIESWKNAGLIL